MLKLSELENNGENDIDDTEWSSTEEPVTIFAMFEVEQTPLIYLKSNECLNCYATSWGPEPTKDSERAIGFWENNKTSERFIGQQW